MNEKMVSALNNQIKNEFYSHNVYLSMAGYFEGLELKGFAAWFRAQAKEELEHGMKIFNFLIERNIDPKILAIDAPAHEWNSPTQVFQEALRHEEKVTKMINELYELSMNEKDYASKIFLGWFVTEQVEEEANAREILAKVEMAEKSKETLLLLDLELAKRK